MPMNPRLMRPLARRQAPGTPASLLLRFDGNFNDSSPNALTVTADGDAAISTTQSKFGGASGVFSYPSWLTSDAAVLDDQTLTVEAWVYLTANVPTGGFGLIAAPHTNAPQEGMSFGFFGLGDGTFIGASYVDQGFNGGPQIALNQWIHVAYVLEDGVGLRLYVDGVLVHSAAPTGSNPHAGLYIGAAPDGLFQLEGYIDDLRIVKGLAVYTANFTPPTGPLAVNATPVT